MRKKLENFDIWVGDIAAAKVTRKKTRFIEVAMLEEPSLRCLFTYDDVSYVSGNIPREQISYITAKVKRNKKFLKK